MRLRQMAVKIECQDQDYRKLRGLNEQKRERYLKNSKSGGNFNRPLR